MRRNRSFRLVSLLLTCLLVAFLAGCWPGEEVTTVEEPPQAKAPAAAASEGPKLSEEMRLPWSREGSAFVREWLICGAFPSPWPAGQDSGTHPGPGHATDFLKAAGGEAVARPTEGQTVTRPDGSAARWRRYVADADVLDFKKALPDEKQNFVVAYAAIGIQRDKPGKAVIALGSDDSVKVWLNGKQVHENVVGRSANKDEDVVPVALKAGYNHLLVKVENGQGGWGLVLRVLNEAQVLGLEAGEIRPRLAEPPAGQSGPLVVRTDVGAGSIAAAAEPVSVAVVAPGGALVASADAKRGEVVRLPTAGWADGPYEVRVWQVRPDGRRVFRHLPWYKGDWLKQVGELLGACDKLPARCVLPADLRLRVLGQFVLDRLGGDPRSAKPAAAPAEGPAADRWRSIHSPLMEHREVLSGRSGAIRPHGFLRLAWVDAVDGSPQYARAYLPPDYDPTKPWPMFVVLHGYNPPNPEYVRWWGTASRHSDLAERHNAIVLEPHGRGNTSYNGIGDADVLRAIRLAKQAFRVDDDRVYLMGYSMGGGGTWHVGTRHPELFAAIGPIYGGWDYREWMDEDQLAKLTPRRRFLAESDSSFAQADALLTTPVFINHGDDDDLVDVKFSRYAVRMLQRWGYEVRYWEHPGKGHGRLGCEDELGRWFLSHRRNGSPRRVRVRSARLKSGAAHWVRVEQQADPYAFIRVDARVAGAGVIRLDTENVLQVRLSPGRALIDHDRPVRVVWNGEDAGLQTVTNGAITLRAKGYEPKQGQYYKTPRIAGPIDDATTTPFAIVAGTCSKDPLMRRFCLLRAEASRDAWRTWQRHPPRYFLDTEITDEQIRTYSLLLFGGPEENLVTRKLAEYVALKVEPHWITIGGHAFPAAGASMAMVCPHPYRADRYVSITAGNSPAGMYFAHHLPGNVDFAIADGRMAGNAPFEDLCVAAGRFDHRWQCDERYTFRGNPAARARAAVRKAPTRPTAAVPGPRLMLSQLAEIRSAGSFTYMVRDRNWQTRPIRLGGKDYAGGIAVACWHEPCTVTYDLAGGNWQRLRATIGIEVDKPEKLEDKQKQGTRVYFLVRGDGKELYRSPTFLWNSGPVEMDVDVTGVKRLELEVANEVTWHSAASSVNWANVRLEKQAAPSRSEPTGR